MQLACRCLYCCSPSACTAVTPVPLYVSPRCHLGARTALTLLPVLFPAFGAVIKRAPLATVIDPPTVEERAKLNVLCLLRGCPSSSQRQLIPLGLPFYPEKHTPGTGQSASRWQPRIWLLSRRKGECNVNHGACQELVGQEAFVQPVLALCSAPYKMRGKKLSWSHGIAIEAGLDSSAPVPAAAWVMD